MRGVITRLVRTFDAFLNAIAYKFRIFNSLKCPSREVILISNLLTKFADQLNEMSCKQRIQKFKE